MYRIMSGLLLLTAWSVTFGQNPNEPVGPTKPVAVEGTVTAVLDEPIEVQGSVSSTENRNVFQFKRFLSIPNGSPAGGTARECFEVPADRWLLIEQIHSSLLSETSPESSFVALRVEVEASSTIGTGFPISFRLEPVGDRTAVGLPGTFFSVSERTKLYSSPGSSVCMYLQRGFDGFSLPEETGNVTLFGVLTDQP